ncbi:Protein ltv1 [Lecanora helva]
MPQKQWIDKSNSTTFQLVSRPQNDPKIHDSSSSSTVFRELAPSQSHKIKSRHDLESELFGPGDTHGTNTNIRDNEGEAAEYGVYFDDSEYDYMQHIRDLNAGGASGETFFVEATKPKKEGKGKTKLSLEEALRKSSLRDQQGDTNESATEKSQLLDDAILPSKGFKKGSYQDQQDVPDALAGFQPDMDPRLREVLEALDDEAYVDDEEDIFGELAKDGNEVSLDDFEKTNLEEEDMDDAGWETDETEKPNKEYNIEEITFKSAPPSADTEMTDKPDHGDGDWMKEFSKFKQAEKAKKPNLKASNADLQSSIMTGTSTNGGRRKKRKGAMTSSTEHSMTSSSLYRTEGQSLLDARFDKIEEEYAEDEMDIDDGTASMVTGSSLASTQAPSLTTRSDFDSVMDDFLGGYSMSGKKRVKKGGYQSGMDQLDEVRKGLGPARVKAQKA